MDWPVVRCRCLPFIQNIVFAAYHSTQQHCKEGRLVKNEGAVHAGVIENERQSKTVNEVFSVSGD